MKTLTPAEVNEKRVPWQFKLGCSCCGEVTFMKWEQADAYIQEGKTSPCCNTSCYCITHIASGRTLANTFKVK